MMTEHGYSVQMAGQHATHAPLIFQSTLGHLFLSVARLSRSAGSERSSCGRPFHRAVFWPLG